MNAEITALKLPPPRALTPGTSGAYHDGWNDAIDAVLERLAASRPAPAPKETDPLTCAHDTYHRMDCPQCDEEAAAPAPAVGEAAHWRDMFQSKLAEAQRQGDQMVKFSMTQGQMQSIVAALAATPPTGEAERHDPPMGFCQWLDEGSDYTTECGHGWQFMDGGVEQNDAKFCLFCGGEITVVAALAPRAQEPCKDGHSYRRNAPPQAGDVCIVCRVAVWQPGLPAHHGVTPSPETQPATNGADGADFLVPHPGGRDLRVEFHQDGSYTVHDTRPGPRKFVRLVTDAEWPPPAPGAGVALSAEQSGYVRQLERLVARVRAGEVRFLRYAATNGTREVENGDIRLIEPTGEVELTLWYQQTVAPDDRALGTASRTENRRHP